MRKPGIGRPPQFDYRARKPRIGTHIQLVRWHHRRDGRVPELIEGRFIHGTATHWTINTDTGPTTLDMNHWAQVTA